MKCTPHKNVHDFSCPECKIQRLHHIQETSGEIHGGHGFVWGAMKTPPPPFSLRIHGP